MSVIACIDGTNASGAVCDYGAWASLRLTAPLVFLHVLERSEYPMQSDAVVRNHFGGPHELFKELAELDEKRAQLALENGRLMLKTAQHRAVCNCVGDSAALQRHGSLVHTLSDMEDKMRLLVMGKHDEHLHQHVGSRLETVVRTTHRPILVTPSTFTVPQRIMLAFDGSTTTRKGVELIAASPLLRGLPCHIVMVGVDSASNRAHLHWAQAQLETAGLDISAALVSGDVERALCDYRAAHGLDMVVMGAYGHSAVRRFLVGSTTTQVLRDASVPVLLLR